MAVQGIDLVSDTTVKELVEQIKYGNALRAAEAADSLATLKGDFKGIQSLVRNGLASKVFEPGDQIVVPWTDKDSGKQYQVPMDIVHFGDVTLKDGEVVPGMYLQWHYATPYGVMFDAYEALYYAAEELPAGAYTFNIPSAWSKAEAGDYTFTLTQAVPAGGQIAGLKLIADNTPDKWTVQTYKDRTTTEAIESVKVIKGNAGTSLGQLIPAGSEKLNSIHRVGYGYNRWSQSAIRQYLNSTAAAGKWWKPQNNYDRPPEQVGKAGFLAGFEKDFLDVLGTIKVTTALNTVTDKADGDTEVTYDKIFLPSLEQIYVVPQLKGVEGEYWEYWKRATGAVSPQAQYGTYPERITYGIEAQTSAQYVRLRSAYRGYGYITWGVYTSGNVLSYGGACIAWRCAPACVIC